MLIRVSGGVARLNGTAVGSLKRSHVRGQWLANVDRLTRPYRPIHDRPQVCERWNYQDRIFAEHVEALAWIQGHADAIAEAFPVRFGLPSGGL